MRFISLLLSLLVLGFLIMTYLKSPSSTTNQASSRPKETIDRAEQKINKVMDDYQKKLDTQKLP